MKTIYELQRIADRLRASTEVNSISPEDTFGLQADVLEYLADMEQNAEGLGIHQVYASYAAMLADASSPVGSNGKPLRFGQLVVIYDSSNTTQAESGNVYAWQKGNTGASAWKLMGNLGNVHALQSQIDSLLSSDESMKGKLTELEEEILGELSASVTRYNSFQRRGEIIKHFSSGDKITLSANGTAVSNSILVRYDDNTTNITMLANNGESSIVTLSKDTTKLIIVCNDNNISVDGTIVVKAKFADSIKSTINDVKDELAAEKSRAILSEQTNAANIATLNEQVNGREVFETVEPIETVADRYLNKLNNRIGTYVDNNLSIIKYAIEKGNTYYVSIAKTCNSAGYVLAYVETLSSLDFVPVIDKLGDRGAYEGSFVSDRNGYLFLGISTDSTSNIVNKITIGDSIVKDIEELKKGSIDWSGKKWFVIGDSLSTLNSTTTKRYIDYIVEKTGINAIVRAVGGSSWGKPQLTDAFFKQALDTPTDTDIVTIFGSFNSWRSSDGDGPSNGKGSVEDDGIDTYYGCVNTCFKNIYDKAPLAKVGVIFPTPWATQNPFTYNQTAETLISVIDSASKKWGIPTLDLFRRSGMRPWDLTYRQLVYSKDSGGIDGNPAGVHPNEIGHEIIATHVLEFMKTL